MHPKRLLVAACAVVFCLTAFAADIEISKVRCSELGAQFAARFKSEYASAVSVWGNPEFHYNNSLSTCLAYTEIVDGALNKEIDAVWYYRRITDLYSNKVLAYSRYLVSKNDSQKRETMVSLGNVGGAQNSSSSEFAATKARLFNE